MPPSMSRPRCFGTSSLRLSDSATKRCFSATVGAREDIFVNHLKMNERASGSSGTPAHDAWLGGHRGDDAMSKSLNILWSGTALGAALLLAACHPRGQGSADGNTYALPALPATLPLAAGAATAPRYAPSADALPAAPRLRTVRVAGPRGADDNAGAG